MSKIYKNKKGFTLVELAIVLVIIGFVAGGVLAGQELIAQARIRAQLSAFGDYDRAAGTFRLKYGFLPGDLSPAKGTLFSLSAANDDGQNTIEDGMVNFWETPPHCLYGDVFYFFINLTEAGLIKGHVVTQSGEYSHGDGKIWPSSIIERGGIFAISMADGKLYYSTQSHNDYAADCETVTLSASGTYRPSVLKTIDTKVDDGIPSKGGVRAVNIDFTPDVTASGCVLDGAGNSYNVTSDTTLCRFVFRSSM